MIYIFYFTIINCVKSHSVVIAFASLSVDSFGSWCVSMESLFFVHRTVHTVIFLCSTLCKNRAWLCVEMRGLF